MLYSITNHEGDATPKKHSIAVGLKMRHVAERGNKTVRQTTELTAENPITVAKVCCYGGIITILFDAP